MKKNFTLLAFTFFTISLQAQTVDFAAHEFVTPDGEHLDTLFLTEYEGLKPSIRIINFGPDVIAYSDTLHLDVHLNNIYLTTEDIPGKYLQNFAVGDSVRTGRETNILSASEMNDWLLFVPFELCYTVRISGQTVDPNENNNRVCITVIRDVDLPGSGVNDITDNGPAIYPNPASNFINIDNAENATVTLFDLSGRVVLSENIAFNQHTLDVSNLSKGLYILRIQGNNDVMTKGISIVR